MTAPKRLTDIGIKNLRPKETRYEVPDPGARGLYVIVHPSGNRATPCAIGMAVCPAS